MLNDMKKIILILLLAGSNSLFAQGYISIHGTVTDSLNGFPVPNHPVTIMSDSTYGFFYYNTVYTDSVGFYLDYIPVMNDTAVVMFVSTRDCNEILLRATILINPGISSYTQDFQICTSMVECHAEFTYMPDNPAPPSYQFIDRSTGNISAWQWDFGDGSFSQEQNPLHVFSEPGTYTTCLTVTGNNCTDTYCMSIVISDTVYLQLYGQVFAGNFPLQHGEVSLFASNPGGSVYPVGDPFPVDSNGIYFFTLVPEGTYYIQAVPYDSSQYFPTYYGDVINWQNATQISLGVPENPYNIQLVQVPPGSEYYGTGSLSGQINNLGMDRSLAGRTKMILMDENITAIGFCNVSSTGSFVFPSLDYGVYHVRAELAGVSCDNMKFEITPERPHLDVVMNYSGNSVLSLEEPGVSEAGVLVYPNPVKNELHISFGEGAGGLVHIGVYSATGQELIFQEFVHEDGDKTVIIPFDHLTPGIYYLRIISEDKSQISKKIIKTN